MRPVWTSSEGISRETGTCQTCSIDQWSRRSHWVWGKESQTSFYSYLLAKEGKK